LRLVEQFAIQLMYGDRLHLVKFFECRLESIFAEGLGAGFDRFINTWGRRDDGKAIKL
jgi:hypothetical protein